MIEFPVPSAHADETAFNAFLEAIPNRPAVFLLWAREGRPYLARTNVLRRRVSRLLKTRETPSRSLDLRGTVERIEFELAGSRLESQFLLWELARRHYGRDYREIARIRFPYYVKLVLTNPFPRTQVTARLGRAEAVYVGPFRNRSTAAQFEAGCLDLFQLRRCEEDLAPHEDHPGCMYGEMGKCLRPCQLAVGPEEYRAEAGRVRDFLRTGGRSLLEPASNARERLSAELDFEGAALMHERCKRIEEVTGTRDEMARGVDKLHGIAVLPSAEEHAIELGWLRAGRWLGFTRLELESRDGNPVSLDARLRELSQAAEPRPGSHAVASRTRMEELAILSRWFYSSWRDGEMLIFDEWDKIPYRRLVNAISRVASADRKKQKA